MQLERVMSMMRYCPPKGTAGLARSRVRGKSRSPAPPASNTPSVSLIAEPCLRADARRVHPRRAVLPRRPLAILQVCLSSLNPAFVLMLAGCIPAGGGSAALQSSITFRQQYYPGIAGGWRIPQPRDFGCPSHITEAGCHRNMSGAAAGKSSSKETPEREKCSRSEERRVG